MDGITHAMAGVLIGSAAAGGRKTLYPMAVAGLAGALLPDLDAPVLVLADIIDPGETGGGYYFYTYHRIFTHTVFAAPFLALLAALPAWIWLRSNYVRAYLIGLGAVLGHFLLDWPCHWTIHFLYPLSKQDFSSGWPLFHFGNMDTSVPVLAAMTALGLAAFFLRSRQGEDSPPGAEAPAADERTPDKGAAEDKADKDAGDSGD